MASSGCSRSRAISPGCRSRDKIPTAIRLVEDSWPPTMRRNSSCDDFILRQRLNSFICLEKGLHQAVLFPGFGIGDDREQPFTGLEEGTQGSLYDFRLRPTRAHEK